MAYINQPFDLRMIMSDIDQRLRKLETAQRLTAPNVNFNTSTPTNPRVGDMYYDTHAAYLKYWNGTSWINIADDNLATPLLTYTSTWAGTGLTYTGTPTTARYMVIGPVIHFNIYIACTTVTNFGTGAYTLTLPTTSARHSVVNGGLHKGANHYNLLLDIENGSNVASIYYPTSNGVNDTMTHNKPTTLTTAEYFYFSGHYFRA
jgi:hypothetical protein